MNKYSRISTNSNDLSHHILPNSATMVGVCIMVISIVKSSNQGLAIYLIDKALAVDSVLFMISALLSFLSIRLAQKPTPEVKKSVSTERIEVWAELIFLLGLVSMTLITVIFTFEFV